MNGTVAFSFSGLRFRSGWNKPGLAVKIAAVLSSLPPLVGHLPRQPSCEQLRNLAQLVEKVSQDRGFPLNCGMGAGV